MSEIVFGTTEHIAGLSREALEADFRYVQDRRTELEEACERLQAENDSLRKELAVTNPLFETLNAANDRLIYENIELRELVRDFYPFVVGRAAKQWLEVRRNRMRELGVETGEL